MCGYLLRTALCNGALSVSHQATFRILKTIRQKLLAKLPKLPLGTVVDTASGKLKQIIVDQVDSMEIFLKQQNFLNQHICIGNKDLVGKILMRNLRTRLVKSL